MRRLLPTLLVFLIACGAPAPTPPQRDAPAARDTVVERGGAPAATGPQSLHVDHAWVKDAPSPAAQAKRHAMIEALRAKIEGGTAFVAAFESMHVDPAVWHVAEGETYPQDVIPEGARDLPAGSLSAIIPGNGGLHLFRILGRERAPE